MVYETDERLKSYLDTNQLARERLCLAVLAIDKRFSNVKPRHPRGGPDGKRDIDATFQHSHKAFGAVGFLNQANDSDEHRKRAIDKFQDDLDAALAAEPDLKVFVFLTNVNLTISEKDGMVSLAHEKGISECEILDRERIRIVLDSPDGFSIRFQYLNIPLSEAEQASFFAKWGDDIQGVISDGLGKLEKTLNRLQFLAETNLPLSHFTIILDLDREYLASEIGHFRAFCSLELREPKHRIAGILFGTTDDPNRNDATSVGQLDLQRSGIGQGQCGGHWEERLHDNVKIPDPFTTVGRYTVKASSFVARGLPKLRVLNISFSNDSLIRIPPYLLLRDVDEVAFALFLNHSLANKIAVVRVYANEYKLAEYSRKDMKMDLPFVKFEIPMCFADVELADEWVRIMNDLSPFRVSFSERTPLRTFSAGEIEGISRR